jgi:hypothetical protein
MEKRGVIESGRTPPEHDPQATPAANFTEQCEKEAESSLDAIRRLDGDFRKEAADRAKKAL